MAEQKKISIGGQAVIEGVVMRSTTAIATAVRRKDRTIEVKKEHFISVTQKNPILKLPVIRGFISLIEVLIIGIKTLNFSAARAELDLAENDNPTPPESGLGKEENDAANKKSAGKATPQVKKEKSKAREQLETFFAFFIAFVLAFGIFTYLPYQVAYLLNLEDGSFLFNLFTGIIRIIFFVGYVKGISMLKDIRTVFEYHGAEHKAVHAFENKITLTPEHVDTYTTIHPRCGTSFIFLVLMISILFFSIVDYFVALRFGVPHLFVRIGYHLLMLPLISGFSYEVLKKTEKHLSHPLVKLLTLPGMMLQRITTQPPNRDQLEVAIVSLCSALDLPYPEADKVKVVEIK